MANRLESKSGGVQRVKNKLEQSVRTGDFYEAHQMYRTLYARYNQRKKCDDARDLVLSGARLFFAHYQIGSAFDLCLLFVESLILSKKEVSDSLIETLGELHSNMDQDHPDLEKFENKSLLWSTASDDAPKTGSVVLRRIFAQNHWKKQNWFEARHHFMNSHDGCGCGEMLVQLSLNVGLRGEEDMFIAQAVLQFLCIQSVQTAHDAFSKYTEIHPRISSRTIPFSFPLLNFIFFLLAAIDSRKLSWFTVLCELYKPSLQRDPNYSEYLERIGEKYFGLKFPKKKGMFENLIGGLFENDETDASETSEAATSAMQVEDLD